MSERTEERVLWQGDLDLRYPTPDELGVIADEVERLTPTAEEVFFMFSEGLPDPEAAEYTVVREGVSHDMRIHHSALLPGLRPDQMAYIRVTYTGRTDHLLLLRDQATDALDLHRSLDLTRTDSEALLAARALGIMPQKSYKIAAAPGPPRQNGYTSCYQKLAMAMVILANKMTATCQTPPRFSFRQS